MPNPRPSLLWSGHKGCLLTGAAGSSSTYFHPQATKLQRPLSGPARSKENWCAVPWSSQTTQWIPRNSDDPLTKSNPTYDIRRSSTVCSSPLNCKMERWFIFSLPLKMIHCGWRCCLEDNFNSKLLYYAEALFRIRAVSFKFPLLFYSVLNSICPGPACWLHLSLRTAVFDLSGMFIAGPECCYRPYVHDWQFGGSVYNSWYHVQVMCPWRNPEVWICRDC